MNNIDKKQAKSAGKKRYLTRTFGCQMNAVRCIIISHLYR